MASTIQTWDKKATSLFETTLNTRDLGGYRTKEGTYTKHHSLIRSDMIKHPSERDVNYLLGHQICTIIDMRGEKEILSAPSPFAADRNFHYYHIPIVEGSGIAKSISDVPYWYMRIAESRNMADVFRRISGADGGVLFHCAAGKDRTGVVSAILLLFAGVSRKEIISDYMITKECNRERFRLAAQRFPKLDINIFIPHEEYMSAFLELFLTKYILAEQYLQAMGLKREEILGIKSKL